MYLLHNIKLFMTINVNCITSLSDNSTSVVLVAHRYRFYLHKKKVTGSSPGVGTNIFSPRFQSFVPKTTDKVPSGFETRRNK